MATSDSGHKSAELQSDQPGSAVMSLVLVLHRALPPPRTLLVF